MLFVNADMIGYGFRHGNASIRFDRHPIRKSRPIVEVWLNASCKGTVMQKVSDFRIRRCNEAPLNPDGDFVLYWMIANRRTRWNFSLQRAVEWTRSLEKPLVVLEALRCGYQWASDRFHLFVMEGMKDNAEDLAGSPTFYYPYLEPKAGAGKGLLKELATDACCVVTDDYPCFFLPRMLASAARQVPVLLEAVDSNGILPMRWTDKVFATAYNFRRYLQKNLEPHLAALPARDPVREVRIPRREAPRGEITDRWPPCEMLRRPIDRDSVAAFPIDHSVRSSPFQGGSRTAEARLSSFLDRSLERYADQSNHPDADCSTGLSPYLHFGHISVHQVFAELMEREDWSLSKLSASPKGKRSGWWGVSSNAEALLDQLITWRELGFNMCTHRSDYDRYGSLPDWARQTLDDHRHDPRPYLYSLEALETANTHDAVWNAAQTQLVREGRLHNYLRMVWGKKILEWSLSPQQALDRMIELNNRYALDGRDPNSYSGIFWVLGRYDRAWGPERPIFGKVRYMSSANTRRKLKLKRYLQTYGEMGDALK